MSDKVTCDRKGCDEWLPIRDQHSRGSLLGLVVPPPTEPEPPRRFLMLRGLPGGTGADLHFCSLECLATWAEDTVVNQNT